MGLTDWDIVVMMETWIEKKGWVKIKERLPRGYIWETQWARKRNNKGRAMGGLIMEIRKGIEIQGEEESEVEGILEKSRDGKVNKKGRWLVDRLEEGGWFIFNRNDNGDERGDWTYKGKNRDRLYNRRDIIGDEEVWEGIDKMEVESRVDSKLFKLQRDNLRIKAGRRAWNFEKRMREGKGNELARECWKEMRERMEGGKRKEEFIELEKVDKEKQREERREKIRNSRFNRWYGRVKKEGMPVYLKKIWAGNRWKRMVNYRLGCGYERETWEHVWEECGRWGAEGSW
ncbi:hypothetical protein ALC57_08555 [Trachymyrmex cornetzi]|uniref:Uncharacterized protein n=1 Tax=Trachymyrmex cornetzi TaxID=471704 RepID=A0A151J6U4_9HYME|nr:hypothetical protein ALC57_08555 [Trachymyrmex cornetzi]